MAAEQTATHKATQVAIVAGLAELVTNAFDLLDIRNLRRSTPRLQGAIHALVTQYGRASSTAALSHYRQERARAGIPGRPSLKLAALPPREQIDKTVSWAVSDLYGADATEVLPAAQDKLTAATETLVLNTGRESMVGFTNQDAKARGYAREARADGCAFCRMLATRGVITKALYRTEGTAGRDANAKFTGDGEFKFHNGCHCVVVPVFGAYEAPAHTRADAALYADVTKGKGDKLNAWRRAVEGR